jgi:hypothetical protein
MERLFVVVGAGASHGCAPDDVQRNPAWQPPLVKTLFSAAPDYGYHSVLAKYELAGIAAAELATLDDSAAIEEVLRERYRDAESELDRRIFNSIAPYLQELLHTVSNEYTAHPAYLQAVVAALLRLPEVVFITLNYDLILDRVLAATDPHVPSKTWYVQPERNWSLIKLHGSVNWYRQLALNDLRAFFSPPAEVPLASEIQVGPLDEALHTRRGMSSPGGGFAHGDLKYPVLSVPQGRTDELACPDDHVEFLRQKLADSAELDLLFLGYSAHDAEVMKLIRDSGKPVSSLLVVDRDLEAAQGIVARLKAEHGIVAVERLHTGLLSIGGQAHNGDFGSWVTGGGLAEAVGAWR